MNILITGATGFIGRNVAEILCSEPGHRVVCMVRSKNKADKFLPENTERFFADINDQDLAEKLRPYDLDAVFHCSGYVENKNPERLRLINVKGTRNICRLCLDLKVKRMVYTSSVAVVSGHFNVPLTEDLPYKATNLYGESKIAAEKTVLSFRRKGLPVSIIRPPMIYGEHEPHLLPVLLKLMKLRLFPVIDNGKNKLHMAYVKNVAAALVYSLTHDGFLSGTYFAADQEVLTQKQVFSFMARGIKASLPWNIPGRLKPCLLRLPGLGSKLYFFLKDRVYSTEKIKALGFIPPYGAEQSLIKSSKATFGYNLNNDKHR